MLLYLQPMGQAERAPVIPHHPTNGQCLHHQGLHYCSPCSDLHSVPVPHLERWGVVMYCLGTAITMERWASLRATSTCAAKEKVGVGCAYVT